MEKIPILKNDEHSTDHHYAIQFCMFCPNRFVHHLLRNQPEKISYHNFFGVSYCLFCFGTLGYHQFFENESSVLAWLNKSLCEGLRHNESSEGA